MKTRLLLALLGSIFAISSATAVTRNVPGDHPTIQAALNASTFGDIILVAPGTYIESLIIGAQQNGVTLQSTGGPEVTTIDANHVNRVIKCSNVGSLTTIKGFTMTNGVAQPGTGNNIGGGIRLDEAHPRIEGNIIHHNFAEAAGGLYINFSSPTLVNNIIRDNEALASGGGIYCDHFSDPVIQSNVIARNISGQYGGGITAWETSSPHIISNTIVLNRAVLGGGGLYITRRCQSEILRNIIANNPLGGGIARDDTFSPTLGCNDVWGNTPVNYSGIGDVTGTDGNISNDPLFCDLANLDVRLSESSPCASAHSPAGCNLIGARDVGCGLVSVEGSTWGRIKTTLAR